MYPENHRCIRCNHLTKLGKRWKGLCQKCWAWHRYWKMGGRERQKEYYQKWWKELRKDKKRYAEWLEKGRKRPKGITQRKLKNLILKSQAINL